MKLRWPFGEDRTTSLLLRARGGDEDAFGRLYEELYPRVWAFVARRTRSREDAEDLVSRTFHRLLERMESFDEKRGEVAPFALSIARNLLVDDARALRQNLPLEEAGAALADARTPLAHVLRDEELRSVRAALDALPAEVREMFALRFGDGLRHSEVAQLLGLSEDAVKQRFSRALRELRTALAAAAGEEVLAP